MPRKERHTKRRDAVIKQMMQGKKLCASFASEGRIFWLEPGGANVGPVTARKVLALPTVVGEHDSLFGSPQTYRYRPIK